MNLPPHPPLNRYYVNDGDRQGHINQAFNSSAHEYDRINRIMSLGSDRWYRRKAVERAGLTEGMSVLDVGCGTGQASCVATKLVGPAGFVVGVDPSMGMLSEAVKQGRVKSAVLAQAEMLPFPDDTFDFLTMSFALRHVSDLAVAFREYRRVLKPGGRVLLLELTLPPAGLSYVLFKAWMKYSVPAITRVMTGSKVAERLYSYCWDTFDQSVSPTVILEALRAVGFQGVERHLEARYFSEFRAQK